jgi:uncharacterized protein (DUF488 family)
MAEPREIITVGHSNHEESAFIELLSGAGVTLLADVRANPRSRYQHFNRSPLAASLSAAGISYEQLGAELGGRRTPTVGSRNDGWEDEAFRGYADHMASPDFQAGIARLESLAGSPPQRPDGGAGIAAVMCAESDWTLCHRRLIADALLERGWRVRHLGPDGSLGDHELTPFASREDGGLVYPAQQTSLGL